MRPVGRLSCACGCACESPMSRRLPCCQQHLPGLFKYRKNKTACGWAGQAEGTHSPAPAPQGDQRQYQDLPGRFPRRTPCLRRHSALFWACSFQPRRLSVCGCTPELARGCVGLSWDQCLGNGCSVLLTSVSSAGSWTWLQTEQPCPRGWATVVTGPHVKSGLNRNPLKTKLSPREEAVT